MKRLVHHFLHDTTAAVSLETVIVFPFLTWAWVGTFTFFDAYRTYNSSIKATFTVSDLISRQQDGVEVADLEGMARILEAMIRDTDGVDMRVTQVFHNADGDYVVDWSYATGTYARLFDANIPGIRDQIPDMHQGHYVLVVESFIDYDPAFNIGLNEVTFDNFTVTRPRYTGRILGPSAT